MGQMMKPSMKSRWNVARAGLATVLGLKKLGFFIPFRHAASVPDAPPVYAEVEALMACREDAMGGVLQAITTHGDELARAVQTILSGHWNGGYFGPLDTAAAFAMLRDAAPARILEVGSGSSTHVMRAACPKALITCIDPAPRRQISDLGVNWHEGVLTAADVQRFAELEAGDIAFFDSSHVLVQGSDVDIIQNRILPMLAPGVLVHIHDIFLPDIYPSAWVHRAYTEQVGLVGWLAGGAYEIMFSSHYAATRMTDGARAALSVLPDHGAPGGGSLWMRRLG